MQIFRPPSPSSPSHDPFLPSPTPSRSGQPHLPGSSRSPSPSARTPPFPGRGIEGIPDIDDGLGSGIGVGLLFAGPDEQASRRSSVKVKDKVKMAVPNPYAPTSSESDEEIEVDLDEVASVRRSLLRPKPPASKSVSERSKKGWLAHQSVFPPSSSSSSSETESEKATEAETDEDDRSRMMGKSRQEAKSRSRQAEEIEEEDEDLLSPSELYRVSIKTTPYNVTTDLEEPLLGSDELEDERDGRRGKVPVRLHVYHGRFGHWEREGLRKYKGDWTQSMPD